MLGTTPWQEGIEAEGMLMNFDDLPQKGKIKVILLLLILPGETEWKTKGRENAEKGDEASLSCLHLLKKIANYPS